MQRQDELMTNRLVFALCLLSVYAGICAAQEGQSTPKGPDQAYPTTTFAEDFGPFTATLYWENDGSILKRNNAEDRHYTNGSAITITHQPDWVHGFADVATFGETFDKTAAGYILGHQIFTPEDTDASRLLSKDRPYAGYLFGGVYLQRANDRTFDQAQLDIGVVGPASQADHIQNDIHKSRGLRESKGWANQLHDEVTAQVFLRRKWRLDLNPITVNNTELAQQLIPRIELAAGSVYRHAAAGATWRIGHNLPDDFGPGRLADVASATGIPTGKWGAYGFVRAGGRAVEHNLFLEGNSFKDSHGVDGETLVGEIQAGIAGSMRYNGWDVSANYSQTFVSEQFEGQEGSDSFGALMLSARKAF